MTILTLTARLILATTLGGNVAMAAALPDASAAERSLGTPADIATAKAFNAGIDKLTAEYRAEVAAIMARIDAVKPEDLYGGPSLVSAAGIARARAAMADMSSLSRDDLALLLATRARIARYIAATPATKELRSYVQATYEQGFTSKQRESEKTMAAQQAVFSALGKRLDFAEARLGHISIDGNGQLAFADARTEAQFRQLHAALERALDDMGAVLQGGGAGK